MMKPLVDADELLKTMATEAVKQGENMRSVVRELTLSALRSRELSLAQIRQVLKSVTEGVSLGTAKPQIDVEKTLQDAFAGMDDALLKAVQANQIALEQLATQGQSFRESHIKKALTDLEKLEVEFLKTVKQAANRGAKGSRRSGRMSSSKRRARAPTPARKLLPRWSSSANECRQPYAGNAVQR